GQRDAAEDDPRTASRSRPGPRRGRGRSGQTRVPRGLVRRDPMTPTKPVVLQADRKLGETRGFRTELRRRGAIVRMAETAEQAIGRAKELRPDILVLDDDLCQEGGVD